MKLYLEVLFQTGYSEDNYKVYVYFFFFWQMLITMLFKIGFLSLP